MSKKIIDQEGEIKKQVILYQEQAKIKASEEIELQKVLTDYTQKHKEF